MPVVRLERLYPGGPVIGHFAARSGPDNRLLRTFTLRAANAAAVPAMLDDAVKRMDGIYAEALSMGLLRPDQSLIVEQPIDASELVEEAPSLDVSSPSGPARIPSRSADGVDFAEPPQIDVGDFGETDPLGPAPTPGDGGPDNLLPPARARAGSAATTPTGPDPAAMTRKPHGQMALPLDWVEAEEAGNMVVGDANRAAIDLLGRTEWHATGAILIGPPRSGKSKLGAHSSDGGAVAFIDDADALEDEALFHQWNRARDAGKAPLLAARTAPATWGVTLPDLQSRLGGAALADIAEPDEGLLRALITHHLAKRGASIAGEALDFCIARIPRTHAMAEKLAIDANDRALSERRAITMPLVRDLLRIWDDDAQLRLDDDL